MLYLLLPFLRKILLPSLLSKSNSENLPEDFGSLFFEFHLINSNFSSNFPPSFASSSKFQGIKGMGDVSYFLCISPSPKSILKRLTQWMMFRRWNNRLLTALSSQCFFSSSWYVFQFRATMWPRERLHFSTIHASWQDAGSIISKDSPETTLNGADSAGKHVFLLEAEWIDRGSGSYFALWGGFAKMMEGAKERSHREKELGPHMTL